MRHILAHGYFDIDVAIVWEVVDRDVPALVADLSRLLDAQ